MSDDPMGFDGGTVAANAPPPPREEPKQMSDNEFDATLDAHRIAFQAALIEMAEISTNFVKFLTENLPDNTLGQGLAVDKIAKIMDVERQPFNHVRERINFGDRLDDQAILLEEAYFWAMHAWEEGRERSESS